MPASSTTSTAAKRTTSRSTPPRRTTSAPRTGRRRRPPPRWDGLDVARGTAVLLATVLVVGSLLGPPALAPTAWRGLNLLDLVPGVFLVIAGAGVGWRHDSGGGWSTRRRWRRAGWLVAAGALVVLARSQVDPARLAADEILRLATASGLAALALRLPRRVLVPLTGLLLLVPGAAVTGHPFGRGLAGTDPAAGWSLETLVGLPVAGVPLLSLPAAVALVLVGHALGVWAHRRPPGPATGAALGTVGLWCLVATLAVGQIVAPVPVLLVLPVSLAATGLGAVLLATGHLAAVWGGAPGLGAVGRTALPLVLTGTVTIALLPAATVPAVPPLAALTAGGAAAAAVVALARRLDRWQLRA
jgi:hypothetical protein